VPLFFLSSGYFLCGKENDSAKFAKYIKRLAISYIAWTVLHSPQVYLDFFCDGRGIIYDTLNFVRYFLFYGSYQQLWFFPALITAAVLIFISKRILKMSDALMVTISAVLYFLGTFLGNTLDYLKLLPFAGKLLTFYSNTFFTFRNGVFFGFFFVASGYVIAKNAKRITNRLYILPATLFFAMMFSEGLLIRLLGLTDALDMTFFLAPTAIFAFLDLLFAVPPKINKLNSVYFRNCSAFIFGAHMIVSAAINAAADAFSVLRLSPLLHYIAVIVISTLLGFAVAFVSRKKHFGFLKVLL